MAGNVGVIKVLFDIVGSPPPPEEQEGMVRSHHFYDGRTGSQNGALERPWISTRNNCCQWIRFLGITKSCVSFVSGGLGILNNLLLNRCLVVGLTEVFFNDLVSWKQLVVCNLFYFTKTIEFDSIFLCKFVIL